MTEHNRTPPAVPTDLTEPTPPAKKHILLVFAGLMVDDAAGVA